MKKLKMLLSIGLLAVQCASFTEIASSANLWAPTCSDIRLPNLKYQLFYDDYNYTSQLIVLPTPTSPSMLQNNNLNSKMVQVTVWSSTLTNNFILKVLDKNKQVMGSYTKSNKPGYFGIVLNRGETITITYDLKKEKPNVDMNNIGYIRIEGVNGRAVSSMVIYNTTFKCRPVINYPIH